MAYQSYKCNGFVVRLCDKHIKIFRGDNPRRITDDKCVQVHIDSNTGRVWAGIASANPETIESWKLVRARRNPCTRWTDMTEFHRFETHSMDEMLEQLNLALAVQLPDVPFRLLEQLFSQPKHGNK